MTERLREIASKFAALDVVLLGEQSDIVGGGQHSFEMLPRFQCASLQVQAIRHPAGAGEERPFARAARVAMVAPYKSAFA